MGIYSASFIGGVGLILLAVALRGRVIDDDPHCVKCGFNLRGRPPESSRCSECGADLTGPHAVQTTLRSRRTPLRILALTLIIPSAGWLGLSLVQVVREHDWTSWKRTSWLLQDLGVPAKRNQADQELIRRIKEPGAAQSTIDAIVDYALDRQKNRTTVWDPTYGRFIGAAASISRVDDARLRRYLAQSVSATLEIKPKVRRGQWATARIAIRIDRPSFPWSALPSARWETTPLMLGPLKLSEGFSVSASDDRASESSHRARLSIDGNELAHVPDGMHTLTTTVKVSLTPTWPIMIRPVTAELPVSASLELLPADAVVDEFRVDPAMRAAIQGSIVAGRVTHDAKGKLDVRVRTRNLVLPLAVEVVLTKGTAEQSVGTLLIPDRRPACWHAVPTQETPKLAGAVDLHLRPSQKAADLTDAPAAYWGEEIIIKDVIVDGPYGVPFNNDESLRAPIEQAFTTITPPTIERNGRVPKALSISLNCYDAPATLAFEVFLRSGEREMFLDHWEIPAHSGYTRGFLSDDIDPDGRATHADVILSPDVDWQTHSTDPNPPWGGEIVFENIKIESK